MQIPNETMVAVADGAKLILFKARSAANGEADSLTLTPLPDLQPNESHAGSGSRHHSSAANPADSQLAEDDFSAGVANLLNEQLESGATKHLVVIAAPRALGEMRKHYSKQVSEALVGELAKDLTGHSTSEIEKALLAA